MNKLILSFVLLVSAISFAKDYQVTGTVVDITADKLIVDKKGEKFEMALPAGTKTTGGEIKKGAKVTAYYKITVSEVEVKGEAKEAKADTKAEPKAETKAAKKKK